MRTTTHLGSIGGRRRRRRTVESYPDEEVHFVHNPGPDHRDPLANLSAKASEKYWIKVQRAEEKE